MATVITLTTDFGTTDSYVAQLKGAILARVADVVLVDVTHEIAAQDVAAAALVLRDLPRAFGAGTIHLAVVDPGVGSDRPLVVFEAAGQWFVGPDNGLWGAVSRRFPPRTIHRIENAALWAKSVSPTFHGRDILAPVVAHLAGGGAVSEVGPVCSGPLHDLAENVSRIGPRRAVGAVTSIDRFGNILTNIEAAAVAAQWSCPQAGWTVQMGQQRIEGVRTCYADVDRGELLALVSSQGEIEIAVRDGHAAEELGASIGQAVTLEPGR
jgi:S-adenosylmethionine hydrolase